MSLDYRAIRQSISIVDVLELIEYRLRVIRADQGRGPCPFCAATTKQDSRCFSVNLRRNIFRCFSCQTSGNALDLWAKLARLPMHQATLELCRRLNFQPATIENPKPSNRC